MAVVEREVNGGENRDAIAVDATLNDVTDARLDSQTRDAT